MYYGQYVQLEFKNDKYYFLFNSNYLYINENQELVLVKEESGEEEVFMPLPTLTSE